MAVNTHHILTCISSAPVIFFQHLAHRVMGFDQSQPLEIIMQIHSSVNVHWVTLRITPTTAGWLMMCKPPFTFLKEIHPFWVWKAKTGQEVGSGLKRGGYKLHQSLIWSTEALIWIVCVHWNALSASHSEPGNWFPLPRRCIYFFLNCKGPAQVTSSPCKTNLRSLLQH